MANCPICGKKLGCPDDAAHSRDTESGLDPAKKCPLKGAAWVVVKDDRGTSVKDVDVDFAGQKGKTKENGFIAFEDLEPKEYAATISLAGDAAKGFDLVTNGATAKKAVAASQIQLFTFKVVRRPQLKVKVVHEEQASKFFGGATVEAEGPNGKLTAPTQEADGMADFGPVPRGHYTIKVTLKEADRVGFVTPQTPLELDLGDKDEERSLGVSPVNVVKPKVEAEYKVVLLDGGGSAHQASTEPKKIVADTTVIELSFTQTDSKQAYDLGGKITFTPSNAVEAFLDPRCEDTHKLAGADLTKEQLKAGEKLKLYLKGKSAGTFKVALALNASSNPRIKVDSQAAALDMGVVKLALDLYAQDATALAGLTPGKETDPVATWQNGLRDLAMPEQKALTAEQKVKLGRPLHVQKDGHFGRAKLVCKKLEATHWPAGGDVDAYKVTILATAASGAVEFYDAETAGNPWDGQLTVAALKSADKVLWVQGKTATDNLGDVRIDVGMDREAGGLTKSPKRNADWARLTVVEIKEVKLAITIPQGNPQVWDDTKKRFYINTDKDGSGCKLKTKKEATVTIREVKVTASLTKPIKDVVVHFMLAPDKVNPQGATTIPTTWKHVKLVEGLKHSDKPDATKLLHFSAKTDDHGAAATEDLVLSQFGGDKFKLGAYLAEDPHLAKYIDGHTDLEKRKPVLSTDTIQVWRRLDYKFDAMTSADGNDYSAAREANRFETELASHFIEMHSTGNGTPAHRRAIANTKRDEWTDANIGTAADQFLYMALVDTIGGSPGQTKSQTFGPMAGGAARVFTVLSDVIDCSDRALWLVSVECTQIAPQLVVPLANDKLTLEAYPGTSQSKHDYKLTLDLTGLDSAKQYKVKVSYTAYAPVSGLAWGKKVVVDMRHRYKFNQSMPNSAYNTIMHEAGHFLGLAPSKLPDHAATGNTAYYLQGGNHCHSNSNTCIMWDTSKATNLAFCTACGVGLRARKLSAPPIWGADAF